MNQQELASYLASIHCQVENIPGMAAELWEDGEITLTKCNNGELYEMRSLHSIVEGNPSRALPIELFPVKQHNGHAFVRPESYEKAVEIRNILWPQSN